MSGPELHDQLDVDKNQTIDDKDIMTELGKIEKGEKSLFDDSDVAKKISENADKNDYLKEAFEGAMSKAVDNLLKNPNVSQSVIQKMIGFLNSYQSKDTTFVNTLTQKLLSQYGEGEKKRKEEEGELKTNIQSNTILVNVLDKLNSNTKTKHLNEYKQKEKVEVENFFNQPQLSELKVVLSELSELNDNIATNIYNEYKKNEEILLKDTVINKKISYIIKQKEWLMKPGNAVQKDKEFAENIPSDYKNVLLNSTINKEFFGKGGYEEFKANIDNIHKMVFDKMGQLNDSFILGQYPKKLKEMSVNKESLKRPHYDKVMQLESELENAQKDYETKVKQGGVINTMMTVSNKGDDDIQVAYMRLQNIVTEIQKENKAIQEVDMKKQEEINYSLRLYEVSLKNTPKNDIPKFLVNIVLSGLNKEQLQGSKILTDQINFYIKNENFKKNNLSDWTILSLMANNQDFDSKKFADATKNILTKSTESDYEQAYNTLKDNGEGYKMSMNIWLRDKLKLFQGKNTETISSSNVMKIPIVGKGMQEVKIKLSSDLARNETFMKELENVNSKGFVIENVVDQEGYLLLNQDSIKWVDKDDRGSIIVKNIDGKVTKIISDEELKEGKDQEGKLMGILAQHPELRKTSELFQKLKTDMIPVENVLKNAQMGNMPDANTLQKVRENLLKIQSNIGAIRENVNKSIGGLNEIKNQLGAYGDSEIKNIIDYYNGIQEHFKVGGVVDETVNMFFDSKNITDNTFKSVFLVHGPQFVGAVGGGVAAVALSPWTGGTSLLLLPALMAGGGMVGGRITQEVANWGYSLNKDMITVTVDGKQIEKEINRDNPTDVKMLLQGEMTGVDFVKGVSTEFAQQYIMQAIFMGGGKFLGGKISDFMQAETKFAKQFGGGPNGYMTKFIERTMPSFKNNPSLVLDSLLGTSEKKGFAKFAGEYITELAQESFETGVEQGGIQLGQKIDNPYLAQMGNAVGLFMSLSPKPGKSFFTDFKMAVDHRSIDGKNISFSYDSKMNIQEVFDHYKKQNFVIDGNKAISPEGVVIEFKASNEPLALREMQLGLYGAEKNEKGEYDITDMSKMEGIQNKLKKQGYALLKTEKGFTAVFLDSALAQKNNITPTIEFNTTDTNVVADIMKDPGKFTPEEILANAKLADGPRVDKALDLMGLDRNHPKRDLIEKFVLAVHNIGNGEKGKDGINEAGVGNYTQGQIIRKYRLLAEGLTEAGVISSKYDAKMRQYGDLLLDSGVCGGEKKSAEEKNHIKDQVVFYAEKEYGENISTIFKNVFLKYPNIDYSLFLKQDNELLKYRVEIIKNHHNDLSESIVNESIEEFIKKVGDDEKKIQDYIDMMIKFPEITNIEFRKYAIDHELYPISIEKSLIGFGANGIIIEGLNENIIKIIRFQGDRNGIISESENQVRFHETLAKIKNDQDISDEMKRIVEKFNIPVIKKIPDQHNPMLIMERISGLSLMNWNKIQNARSLIKKIKEGEKDIDKHNATQIRKNSRDNMINENFEQEFNSLINNIDKYTDSQVSEKLENIFGVIEVNRNINKKKQSDLHNLEYGNISLNSIYDEVLSLEDKKDLSTLLSYLESKGINHNDLHAGNVMKSHDGQLYIIDFGRTVFQSDLKIETEKLSPELNISKNLSQIISLKQQLYILEKSQGEASHQLEIEDKIKGLIENENKAESRRLQKINEALEISGSIIQSRDIETIVFADTHGGEDYWNKIKTDIEDDIEHKNKNKISLGDILGDESFHGMPTITEFFEMGAKNTEYIIGNHDRVFIEYLLGIDESMDRYGGKQVLMHEQLREITFVGVLELARYLEPNNENLRSVDFIKQNKESIIQAMCKPGSRELIIRNMMAEGQGRKFLEILSNNAKLCTKKDDCLYFHTPPNPMMLKFIFDNSNISPDGILDIQSGIDKINENFQTILKSSILEGKPLNKDVIYHLFGMFVPDGKSKNLSSEYENESISLERFKILNKMGINFIMHGHTAGNASGLTGLNLDYENNSQAGEMGQGGNIEVGGIKILDMDLGKKSKFWKDNLPISRVNKDGTVIFGKGEKQKIFTHKNNFNS